MQDGQEYQVRYCSTYQYLTGFCVLVNHTLFIFQAYTLEARTYNPLEEIETQK